MIYTPLVSVKCAISTHAGCLVSGQPRRGFRLPVAEAMLVGCPVIATIYSGQADIAEASIAGRSITNWSPPARI